MFTTPVELELQELVKNEVDNVSEVVYNKHIDSNSAVYMLIMVSKF